MNFSKVAWCLRRVPALLFAAVLAGGCAAETAAEADPDPLRNPSGLCPFAAPATGEPCDQERRCVYTDCEGDGVFSAVCVAGIWSRLEGVECRIVECGTEGQCAAGEACYAQVGGDVSYGCGSLDPRATCQRVCGESCNNTHSIGTSVDPPYSFICSR